MPTPSEGESEKDFMSRCMAYPDMQKYEPSQRAAICHSKYREESMHPDFERILGKFIKRYGKEGINRFINFVKKNSLDILKAYNPLSQFTESFEWIEPLIKPYKQDKEAKYYLVTALTADISMNNTDYGPEDRLAREDSSMNWRPVNLNHDHSTWLPYPRTRVDFSAVNEFSLEATLRVDNQDAWLQRKLDAGEILHPSIEGRPHPIKGRYHFTGLALLEKGEELPGDPLTEIVPLVFNESVGRSLCEFKDGKMVCECSTTKEVKNNLKEQVKEAYKEEAPPDDSTRCPPDMHWDPTTKQCIKGGGASGAGYQTSVSPEEPQCPEGYHFDATIKKCVEGGGQSAAGRGQEQVATVGDDDKATCPPGQHWDGGKCVDDVKEECEAGWHYDIALQKCIPDNPQVNESQDLRLKAATLELENIDVKEAYAKLKEQYDLVVHQFERYKAEKAQQFVKLSNDKCSVEGQLQEAKKSVNKAEEQTVRINKEHVDLIKSSSANIEKLSRRIDETTESRDKYKGLSDKLQEQLNSTLKSNEKLVTEKTDLIGKLTEAKEREIQWTKEKTQLQEGLTKALKHQKYVYEFLKSKGFELVGT